MGALGGDARAAQCPPCPQPTFPGLASPARPLCTPTQAPGAARHRACGLRRARWPCLDPALACSARRAPQRLLCTGDRGRERCAAREMLFFFHFGGGGGGGAGGQWGWQAGPLLLALPLLLGSGLLGLPLSLLRALVSARGSSEAGRRAAGVRLQTLRRSPACPPPPRRSSGSAALGTASTCSSRGWGGEKCPQARPARGPREAGCSALVGRC